MLPRILVGAIIASFLGLVVLGVWSTLTRETAERLAGQALSAADPEQRLQAALKLSLYGADGVPAMRHVLETSDVPEVRAAMIDGLAAQKDWASMPAILAALEDPNEMMRQRAAAAVNHLFGRDFGLRPDSSTEERGRTIEFIRKLHKEASERPADAFNES